MGRIEKMPSAILNEHRSEILAQWQSQVRKLRAARGLNHYELLDHLPALLDRIGEMADEIAAGLPHDARPQEAHKHAAERLQVGFDLAQLIAEYGILRRSVAHFCRDEPGAFALDEAIDSALITSAEGFAALHEQALVGARRNVRRLEGILSAIFDGVLVADQTGSVALANNGASRVFGVPREALCIPLAEYPARFDLRSPDGEPVPPIAISALAGETVASVERVITPPTLNTDRHIRASAAPLLGEDGAVEGAVVVVSDITDRKKIETDLVDAARLREEILAVVSHDLKNPLGAILMSADHLARKITEPRARKQVDTIRRSAARMDRLMADLLDVASLQVGRLPVDPEEIDVRLLVDEAIESHQPLAHDGSLTLLRDPPGSGSDGSTAPPLPHALADRSRTLQVLSNLLGNAIKFCSPGDTIVVRTLASRDKLHFSVADTGPGIPADDIPHIFEPYWSARNPAKQGTGLGLFISKGIVEAQGGRIWVESSVGAGTTFHFTLPIALPREATPPPTGKARPREQPGIAQSDATEERAERSRPEPP